MPPDPTKHVRISVYVPNEYWPAIKLVYNEEKKIVEQNTGANLSISRWLLQPRLDQAQAIHNRRAYIFSGLRQSSAEELLCRG